MQVEDAELQTVEVFRGAPDMALNHAIDDRMMPQLNAGPYLAAVNELGSPVPYATIATLRDLPPQAVDSVMVNLFGGAMKITSNSDRTTSALICHSVDSTGGAVVDLQVPKGETLALESSKSGEALLSLGFMAPPLSDPLQRVALQPATVKWVYLPDTGKPAMWLMRIRTNAVGVLRLCASPSVRINPNVANYSAEAVTGSLNTGWSAISDAAAIHGRAAKASGGTFVSYESNVFGIAVVPITKQYDVWYRVRVQSTLGVSPEMLLGLWDDEATTWAGMATLKPIQVGTAYSWVRVASAITPTPGHHVQFIAAFQGRLDTAWYIDSAVMAPTGSGPPL
jgi:hypothetical protein